jgi:hypothetical protein
MLLALATLAACTLARAQEVFRWVDRDGGVHYSDNPPPVYAHNQEQKRLGTGASAGNGLPFAVRRAADRNPVTLFATADCGEPCLSGRALLNQRHIPFAEKMVQTFNDAEALKETMGGRDPVVPSLIVGKQTARGFQGAVWSALLDAAGYPKAPQ